MWSDNETLNDLIGFKVHADLIKSVVTTPSLLPITMGVFGDWGSGKTSIMKMLEHDLNPDNYDDPEEKKKYKNILCIYFNGWLFEGYDDAKAAILSSVLTQIKEHQRFGPKVKEKVGSLIKSVDWMRLAHVGLRDVGIPALTAYLSGGLTMVPQLLTNSKNNEQEDQPHIDLSGVKLDNLIKQQEEIHMDVRTFRSRFEKMLQESDISSLVVLIDDLDRCSPERIIDNLEAIKLFLNVENTAFIIGADPRIVKHAIQERYHTLDLRQLTDDDESTTDSLINDYLEKLIQVPYHLPRLSPAEVETYMTLLFCQRDIGDEDLYNQILSACQEQRDKNRYATFGYAAVRNVCSDEKIPDQLTKSLISSSQISPLITEGLKGNPRQIKRFLNAYTLRKQLAEVASLDNIRDDVLVKLMVLEYTSSARFRELFQWQSMNDGFPPQIEELEKALTPPEGNVDNEETAKKVNGQWATSFMRKWVAMEPYLSDIDLRDYFWVARDRLSSTFAGLSMVSPIVRIILEGLVSGNDGRKIQALRQVADLNQDEKASLLELLKSQVLRKPEEKEGYIAIRRLIDENVEGSVQTLKDTFHECPPREIPVAVVQDLLTLIRTKADLKQEFTSVFKSLKEHNKDKPIGRLLEELETE